MLHCRKSHRAQCCPSTTAEVYKTRAERHGRVEIQSVRRLSMQKVALVMGGPRGIGLAIAQDLVRDHDLAVTWLNTQPTAFADGVLAGGRTYRTKRQKSPHQRYCQAENAAASTNGRFGATALQHPTAAEWQFRAECAVPGCASARGFSRPLASTVLPRVLETQTPPLRAAIKRLITRYILVAGTGFEPVTFRL